MFSFQQVKRGRARAVDLRASACTGVGGLLCLQGLDCCMHRRSWVAASSCGAGWWVCVVETEYYQSKCWDLCYHHWKCFSESPLASVRITFDAREVAPEALQSCLCSLAPGSSDWRTQAPSGKGQAVPSDCCQRSTQKGIKRTHLYMSLLWQVSADAKPIDPQRGRGCREGKERDFRAV